MSSRDEFRERTKHAVALRAGYLCSFDGCGRPTVGPSEESTESVTLIGKAAHISAAASGRGSRRYRSEMTIEQRKHIDNAIWLCADHADLIDRDEVKYTIEALQEMKRLHEAAQANAAQARTNQQLGTGLLAVGPDVVCVGDLESIGSTHWTLRLRHFVLGDVHQLVAFIGRFATLRLEDCYVLSDQPERGIARIRQVLAEGRLYGHHLRGLVTALGHSRTPGALALLTEFAGPGTSTFSAVTTEWIEAVGNLGGRDGATTMRAGIVSSRATPSI